MLERYFLFTFLACVRRGEDTLTFGIGDGRFSVDGELITIDSGPDNAPPYCAYRLTSSSPPAVVTHFAGRAAHVAVMTDGLAGLTAERLSSLWAPGLERNPLTLQRRLNVLADHERLHDDATIAVLGGLV